MTQQQTKERYRSDISLSERYKKINEQLEEQISFLVELLDECQLEEFMGFLNNQRNENS